MDTNQNSTVNYAIKYPPRGAWVVVKTSPASNLMHGGYTSGKLRKCPVCGRPPVFEEDADPKRKTGRLQKAKYFIGYCPSCELRTENSGTLKEAVMQWQEKKWSTDSWLHCHRPKLDPWGCVALCEAVVRTAYEDTMLYLDLMRKSRRDDESFSAARDALNGFEKFFRTSIFAAYLDPDAVISKIRRDLFPDMTPEERTQIPLKLSELYHGEEYVKAWKRQCTKKKSSSKRR